MDLPLISAVLTKGVQPQPGGFSHHPVLSPVGHEMSGTNKARNRRKPRCVQRDGVRVKGGGGAVNGVVVALAVRASVPAALERVAACYEV